MRSMPEYTNYYTCKVRIFKIYIWTIIKAANYSNGTLNFERTPLFFVSNFPLWKISPSRICVTRLQQVLSSLQWRHNGRDSVSNHQPHDCLINRLFRRRSKKTSKPRLTGLCAGNSSGTGEFPAQMASYAENVSIWWRHHDASSETRDPNSRGDACCLF